VKFIETYIQRRRTKENLLAIFRGLEKSLESWYVMDQREVFNVFSDPPKECLLDNFDERLNKALQDFIELINAYNTQMKDFKDFEQWYSLDLEHKTKENARTLHAKRSAVEEKFRDIGPVIKVTKELFEQDLLKKNIIRHPSRIR
jgi:hypothetical protein